MPQGRGCQRKLRNAVRHRGVSQPTYARPIASCISLLRLRETTIRNDLDFYIFMDTPSSPKSGSYLGIVVGILAVVAVVLAVVALSKASSLGKKLDDVAALAARVDSMEASVKRVSDDSAKNVNNLRGTYDRYFDQINTEFANLRTQINKVAMDTKDMMDRSSSPAPKAAAASGGGSGAPSAAPGSVASDGSYVIKGGDTLGRIATQFGVSLAELQAANPGVDSRKLHVGQKIVIPKK